MDIKELANILEDLYTKGKDPNWDDNIDVRQISDDTVEVTMRPQGFFKDTFWWNYCWRLIAGDKIVFWNYDSEDDAVDMKPRKIITCQALRMIHESVMSIKHCVAAEIYIEAED